jgi:two-component system sensor histidine kinase DesK
MNVRKWFGGRSGGLLAAVARRDALAGGGAGPLPESPGAPGPEGNIGQPPVGRRAATIKLLWIVIWMLYLQPPVHDLATGHHGTAATAVGWVALAAFVLGYLGLVFFRTDSESADPRTYAALAVLGALGVVLSLTLGKDWLVLFVYLSVACGAALPLREAPYGVLGVSAVLAGLGAAVDPQLRVDPALLIPALLGGMAMVGVKRLVRTTIELREARATVAHLAATEERLRLARDLHDLLGHSLSLITLKSELAGRMLPGRPEDAARQVADIESVSRQALVDVREAVSGYRRPTLPVELAGARQALAAAGIEVRVRPSGEWPGAVPVSGEAEGALAWALREAVTNVVRHSGARRCELALAEGAEPGTVTLTVADDGHGPVTGPGWSHGRRGNGLTGLTERLLIAGGELRTGLAEPGPGFVLTATVPAVPEPVTVPEEALRGL